MDHIPRNLCSLDGSRWEITPERALEEIQSITVATPVRVAWTRKSLENSAPTGSIVASFLHTVHPFILFGSSSVSHQIVKTPRPTQCPKCWGYHDARLCNHEQRCKQCSSKGHSSCEASSRCTNCHGPHSATEKYCPARPIVKGGRIIHLTKSELKQIRQAGHHAWKLVDPTAKEPETNLSQSQC